MALDRTSGAAAAMGPVPPTGAANCPAAASAVAGGAARDLTPESGGSSSASARRVTNARIRPGRAVEPRTRRPAAARDDLDGGDARGPRRGITCAPTVASPCAAPHEAPARRGVALARPRRSRRARMRACAFASRGTGRTSSGNAESGGGGGHRGSGGGARAASAGRRAARPLCDATADRRGRILATVRGWVENGRGGRVETAHPRAESGPVRAPVGSRAAAIRRDARGCRPRRVRSGGQSAPRARVDATAAPSAPRRSSHCVPTAVIHSIASPSGAGVAANRVSRPTRSPSTSRRSRVARGASARPGG